MKSDVLSARAGRAETEGITTERIANRPNVVDGALRVFA
jgi:hypothetical protein